ncbi:MAG: DUF4446 family protein [Clostridiales bacterium]|nr:DUF4446 family protein [Candidatus Blautia equi]
MGEMMNGLGFWNGLLIVLVILLLLRTLGYSTRLTRLERKYKMFMKGGDAQSLEKSFARKFGQIDRLFEAKEDQEKAFNVLKGRFDLTFSKYGVEKYDAFDDVGGKLSFALALLDSNNTGLILNAVHSRDNCFLYLKEIFQGESYVMLSQEEVEALRKAVNFEIGEIDSVDKLDKLENIGNTARAEAAEKASKNARTEKTDLPEPVDTSDRLIDLDELEELGNENN